MTTARSADPPPRTDPARVLVRLGLVSAGVLVLLNSVFPAPDILRALQFDPAQPAARPWALFTYPFVHDGLAHLLGVGGFIALVAPYVVRRMGPRQFLAYSVACVAGAAVLGITLSVFFRIPPLSGALAPAYGYAFARGWLADDGAVALEPLPFRAGVRTLVGVAIGLLLVIGVAAGSPALSVAHAGGLLAGLLWFRIRSLGRRPVASSPLPARRPVMTPVRLEVQESSASSSPTPPARAPAPTAVPRTASSDAEELNRLLDKISEQGFASLTEQERQSLEELAERKKRDAGR